MKSTDIQWAGVFPAVTTQMREDVRLSGPSRPRDTGISLTESGKVHVAGTNTPIRCGICRARFLQFKGREWTCARSLPLPAFRSDSY